MKLRTIATTVSVMAPLLAGCMGEPERPGTNPSGPAPAVYSGSARATDGVIPPTTEPTVTTTPLSDTTTTSSDGQLAGSLGSVYGFTSNAVTVSTLGGGSVVRLDAANDTSPWWVMTQLQFSRPLSDAVWAPGMNRTFVSGMPSSDGLVVNAIGCSGPTRGRFTFDHAPEQVTVRVESGTAPGARVIHFEGQWADAQTVTGSFQYVPR